MKKLPIQYKKEGNTKTKQLLKQTVDTIILDARHESLQPTSSPTSSLPPFYTSVGPSLNHRLSTRYIHR